ncbi:hypothetical protein BHE74_00006531 [Ensete ventricosum]|nr:hypothetical protein BHE74_00006531 [Ensete ventricosum]
MSRRTICSPTCRNKGGRTSPTPITSQHPRRLQPCDEKHRLIWGLGLLPSCNPIFPEPGNGRGETDGTVFPTPTDDHEAHILKRAHRSPSRNPWMRLPIDKMLPILMEPHLHESDVNTMINLFISTKVNPPTQRSITTAVLTPTSKLKPIAT